MKNAISRDLREKRFLLNELGLYDAAVALPTSSGNFGLDARYYGFADYNESEVGLPMEGASDQSGCWCTIQLLQRSHSRLWKCVRDQF